MKSLILIFIYLSIILYNKVRYLRNKKVDKYDIYREEYNISLTAVEGAYLLDSDCNSINLLLAGILELVSKGYIDLEIEESEGKKDYIFIKTEKIDKEGLFDLKKHEVLSYRLFFNEEENDRIYLSEYLDKLSNEKNIFKNFEISMMNIKKHIDKTFLENGVEDKNSTEKIQDFRALGYSSLIIFLTSFIMIYMFKNKLFFSDELKKYMEFLCTGVVFSILLIIQCRPRRILTAYGQTLKEKVKGMYNFLMDYSLIKERPIYTVKILEHKYIWGVAFGIADLSEREFVEPTYLIEKIKTCIIDIIKILIMILVCALILTLIINFFKELGPILTMILLGCIVLGFWYSESE